MRVNGIELHVDDGGTGPAVLLLHGFPDSSKVWRHQFPALVEAGYRVIAPDLRGFGESDRPEGVESYALPLILGDVLGALDELGIERAAVVGHDWGAAVAWALAMTAPQRVTSLVTVSLGHPAAAAAAGMRQRQLSWYMLWFQFPGVAEKVLPADGWAFYRDWAWAGAGPGVDPDADRQIADLSRPGALTAGLNLYRANLTAEAYVQPPVDPSRVPPVSCPTMGVWSTADVALGEEQMTGSAAFVTGEWRYERIEGVSHWIPVHAPDQLNALLIDFLGAHRD